MTERKQKLVLAGNRAPVTSLEGKSHRHFEALKNNHGLCGVKFFMAIELSLFSKTMQTRNHSKNRGNFNFVFDNELSKSNK